jgi:hypothetical protein
VHVLMLEVLQGECTTQGSVVNEKGKSIVVGGEIE